MEIEEVWAGSRRSRGWILRTLLRRALRPAAPRPARGPKTEKPRWTRSWSRNAEASSGLRWRNISRRWPHARRWGTTLRRFFERYDLLPTHTRCACRPSRSESSGPPRKWARPRRSPTWLDLCYPFKLQRPTRRFPSRRLDANPVSRSASDHRPPRRKDSLLLRAAASFETLARGRPPPRRERVLGPMPRCPRLCVTWTRARLFPKTTSNGSLGSNAAALSGRGTSPLTTAAWLSQRPAVAADVVAALLQEREEGP